MTIKTLYQDDVRLGRRGMTRKALAMLLNHTELRGMELLASDDLNFEDDRCIISTPTRERTEQLVGAINSLRADMKETLTYWEDFQTYMGEDSIEVRMSEMERGLQERIESRFSNTWEGTCALEERVRKLEAQAQGHEVCDEGN